MTLATKAEMAKLRKNQEGNNSLSNLYHATRDFIRGTGEFVAFTWREFKHSAGFGYPDDSDSAEEALGRPSYEDPHQEDTEIEYACKVSELISGLNKISDGDIPLGDIPKMIFKESAKESYGVRRGDECRGNLSKFNPKNGLAGAC